MRGEPWWVKAGPFLNNPVNTLWWMQITMIQFSRTNKWTEPQAGSQCVNHSSKMIFKTELFNCASEFESWSTEHVASEYNQHLGLTSAIKTVMFVSWHHAIHTIKARREWEKVASQNYPPCCQLPVFKWLGRWENYMIQIKYIIFMIVTMAASIPCIKLIAPHILILKKLEKKEWNIGVAGTRD